MEYTSFPKSKVELHVHLDGCIRPSTVLHYSRKRNILLPEDCKDVPSIEKHIKIGDGADLSKFLETFHIFCPTIAGDIEAIEQIAYEFAEDLSKHDVAYCEVRYCPHLFASKMENPPYCVPGDITPSQVVDAVNKGLLSGEKTFGIKIRSILCCMRDRPEWSKQILDLCVKFKENGVVGIDIAGNEKLASPTYDEHIKVFQEAKELGINRTVHAGENGGPENVREAMEKLHAQRIGHGYSAIQDDHLYKMMIEKQIHFEMCPWSSIVTGSVSGEVIRNPTLHPLKQFLADGANISLSSDDPVVTGKNLAQEYEFLAKKVQLDFSYVAIANINAAKSSFLPEKEKNQLVDSLKAKYKCLSQS